MTVGYAAVFWAAAMLFPGLLIRVFNSEPEVVAAGIPALRIYFCLFIPMSLQMAGQGVFVSLGRSKQAVFFSLLRKAIINAPLTVVLPIWMGTTGVFTAEAISQLVGGLACSLTMYSETRLPRRCSLSYSHRLARKKRRRFWRFFKKRLLCLFRPPARLDKQFRPGYNLPRKSRPPLCGRLEDPEPVRSTATP